MMQLSSLRVEEKRKSLQYSESVLSTNFCPSYSSIPPERIPVRFR